MDWKNLKLPELDLTKKYQKVLLGLLVSWCISACCLFIGLHFVGAPWLRARLEAKGSALIHGKVEIGGVSFTLLPSVGVRLTEVKLSSESLRLKGQLTELSAYLDTQLLSLVQGGSMMRIRIKAIHPVIVSQEGQPLPVSANGPPPGQAARVLRLPEIRSPRPMSLVLDVTEGEITRLPFDPRQGPNTWKGFQFSIKVPNISYYQAQLDFASVITWEKNGIAVPLDLKVSSGMVLRETVISLPDIQGNVNGIISKGTLSYDLLGGPREIKLAGAVPEIGDLVSAPSFLPHGKWRGSSDYEFHLFCEDEYSEWTGNGFLNLHGLNGNTKFSWPSDNPQFSLDGLVSSDLQIAYTLAASPREKVGGPLADEPLALSALNRLKIDHLKFWLDLSQAQIDKKDSFHKPRVTPLVFEVEGAGTSDQIHIASAHLQFASLKSSGSGDWLVRNPRSSVDVLGWKLKVEPTDLTDWDKYFAIFAGSPVKGKIELQTSFSGDLRHLEKLNLAFQPLLLSQVEGNIHWRSADNEESFSGPIRIDGKLDLENKGTDLRFNEAKLDVDLTQLDMMIKDTLNKKAGVPLSLTLEGAENKGQIEIPQMSLRVHSSQIFMAARMAQPRKPVFAINMIANNLNLGEIAEILTPLNNTGLSGLASGHFVLQGTYDYQEGIRRSALRFTSELKAEIPNLKIPNNWSAAVAAAPTPAPAKERARAAYLDWPVFQTAQMKFQLLIGQLMVDRFHIEGINAAAQVNAGQLSASGSAQKLLSGHLDLQALAINLTDANPVVRIQTAVKDINLSEANHLLAPGWQNQLQGALSGQAKFIFPPLSSSNLAQDLQASGQLQIQNFAFGTATWTDLARHLITEKTARPALAGTVEPATASPALSATAAPAAGTNQSRLSSVVLQGNFELANGAFAFQPLILTAADHSELRLKGRIGLDRAVALTGVASLTPDGAPCELGKLDTQGRCAFQIELKGLMNQPSTSVLAHGSQ